MQDNKTDMQLKTEELVALVKAGDSDAFSELARQYEPMLDRICLRYLNDQMSNLEKHMVEQEALLGFLSAVMSYETEKGAFVSFAKTCILNRFRSYRRDLYKDNAFVEALIGDELDGLSDPDGEVPALYERQERERELREKIENELSEFENKVWRLYCFGFSAKEIACKLECSERSVTNAIFRTRKKLRSLLK